LGQNKLQYLD